MSDEKVFSGGVEEPSSKDKPFLPQQGMRMVLEEVPSIVTVNEYGQAMMDARYWQEYARRANRYYNVVKLAIESNDLAAVKAAAQEALLHE
jgi:hypothetical protein